MEAPYSGLVQPLRDRQKIGDLVVFWPHILSEMKTDFVDREME